MNPWDACGCSSSRKWCNLAVREILINTQGEDEDNDDDVVNGDDSTYGSMPALVEQNPEDHPSDSDSD